MRVITIARLLCDQGTHFGRLDVGGDAACRHPTKPNIAWRTSFIVSSKEPYKLNSAGDVGIAILDFRAKISITARRALSCVTVQRPSFYRGTMVSMRSAMDSAPPFDTMGRDRGVLSQTHKLRITLRGRNPIFELDYPRYWNSRRSSTDIGFRLAMVTGAMLYFLWI